jgi:creatinine amidohydrolase
VKTKKTVLWWEMAYPELEKAKDQGAIVLQPIGSIEQHGPHLPVSCDSSCAFEISRLTAEAVIDTVPVLVLPIFWAGSSTQHTGFPGVISLSHQTLTNALFEIGESVASLGFKKFIFVNGHGGNRECMKIAADRLGIERKLLTFAITYWEMATKGTNAIRESSRGGICHGGEFETSLQLVYQPELVHTDRFSKEIAKSVLGEDTLTDLILPYTAYHVFEPAFQLSKSGLMGDATLGTLEKGKKIVDVLIEEFSRFLKRLYEVIPPESGWD